MRRNAIVLVVSSLIGSSAWAEQPPKKPYSEAFDNCMDLAAGVTSAMVSCANDEYRRQEDRLNEAYLKVMAAADPDQKEELRAAQHAWIAYRDTSCPLMRALAVGSMGPVLSSSCLLQSTSERVKYLRTLEILLTGEVSSTP